MTNFQRGYGEADFSPYANTYQPRMITLPAVELAEMAEQAEAKALRSFRRGIILGAAVMFGAIFAAEMVNGQTIEIGGIGYMGNKITPGSTVTINPSDKPGEWAIVVFENRLVNDGGDTGEYALTFQDVVIPVLFTWEQDPVLGSDRVEVIPPDGIICVPEDCGATVQEGAVAQIILFDWRGF